MFPPSLMPRILDFLVERRQAVPLHKVISHAFPLGEIDAAFQHAEWKNGPIDVVRAVLVP
jgi:hypothetical protein